MATQTGETLDFVGLLPAAASGEWRWPNSQFYPAVVLQISVAAADTTITFSVSIDGGLTFFLMDGWDIVGEVNENAVAITAGTTKRYVFPVAAMTQLRLVKAADASVTSIIGRAYANEAGLLNFSGTGTGLSGATGKLTYWNTNVSVSDTNITYVGDGISLDTPTADFTTSGGCLVLGEPAPGTGGETISICAPPVVIGAGTVPGPLSYQITLPGDDGDAGDSFINDGSGVLTWGPAGGTGTVSATSPLTPDDAMVRVDNTGGPRHIDGSPVVIVRRGAGFEGRIDAVSDINLSSTTGTNTWYGFAAHNTLISGAVHTYTTVLDTSARNAAFGYLSLASVTDGTDNTAVGSSALTTSLTGRKMVAVGSGALAGEAQVDTDVGTVAIGHNAVNLSASCTESVYIGYLTAADSASTKAKNVAIGSEVLRASTASSENTAVGWNALKNLAQGSANVTIGERAGTAYAGGETGNILIGSAAFGTALDSNRTELGVVDRHNYAYIPPWRVRPPPAENLLITGDSTMSGTHAYSQMLTAVTGDIAPLPPQYSGFAGSSPRGTRIWTFPTYAQLKGAFVQGTAHEHDTFDLAIINLEIDGSSDFVMAPGAGSTLIGNTHVHAADPTAALQSKAALFRFYTTGSPPTAYRVYRIA
jgi:hypothetical protein